MEWWRIPFCRPFQNPSLLGGRAENVLMEKETQKKNSPGRIVITAISILLCVVLSLMLVCNIAIIVKGTLQPGTPPSVLGITPLVVLSGSMSGDAEDHIEIGDLIFVDKADPEALEVGDVIAYMEGGVVITHRIVKIQTAADGRLLFTTKGDANNAEDLLPVPEDELVGIYKGRIPKVGDFAMFLQTPLGMILFIGIPVLAFILYDIIRRQRYAARESQKTAQLEAELERLRALTAQQGKE